MRMHVVVAARRGVLRGVAAHRTHVGGDLPNLVVRDFSPERRHAVRPALADRMHDVLDRAAVNPDVVHERRPRSAAAVGVAADAVEPFVELLALAQVIGVFLEFLALAAGIDRRRAGTGGERRERDLFIGLRGDGVRPERAVLALARGERNAEREEEQGRDPGHRLEAGSVTSASARGTWYAARMASISGFSRRSAASISSRSASSSLRTPMEISNAIGSRGPSICGFTGTARSGGVWRAAK